MLTENSRTADNFYAEHVSDLIALHHLFYIVNTAALFQVFQAALLQ